MDHSFKELYEESHTVPDEYAIPSDKRKKLVPIEIEMFLLLMWDVLPYNYSKQGIWIHDRS